MNVVIVDDDAAVLRSLELLLSGKGHTVTSYREPEAACSFLEQGAEVDVLLLDYVMPGLNGEEVLRRLRGYLPEACRVILMSGHTDLVEPLDLRAMGVSTFLPKPLDFDKLCELVGIGPAFGTGVDVMPGFDR